MVSLFFVVVIVTASLSAPLLATHDPLVQNTRLRLATPSREHWFGTDHIGRDIYSRVIWGTRTSVLLGFLGVSLGASLGISLGMVGGYYGGYVDAAVCWLVDLLLAFPGVLLAILIMTMLGSGVFNMVLAISVFSIPLYARLSRGMVLTIKTREYFEAARAVGANMGRLFGKYLLLNSISPLIVYGTMRIATAILTIASLSYLGLGVGPPHPEWGSMVAQAQAYILSAPHMVLAPGVAVFITVMSFNFLGDALRDALDPKMRAL